MKKGVFVENVKNYDNAFRFLVLRIRKKRFAFLSYLQVAHSAICNRRHVRNNVVSVIVSKFLAGERFEQ